MVSEVFNWYRMGSIGENALENLGFDITGFIKLRLGLALISDYTAN